MSRRHWFSAAELVEMGLPGLPQTRQGVDLMAERAGWLAPGLEGIRWRRRRGRGGGIEFHESVLRPEARLKISHGMELQTPEDAAAQAAARRPDPASEALWAKFDQRTDAQKAVARQRLEAVQAMGRLIADGTPVCVAQSLTVAEYRGRGIKLSFNTLGRWRRAVEGLPVTDWWPALLPHHVGRPERRAISEAAWQTFLADYLRLEQPTARACWDRVARQAKAQQWDWPCLATIQRRIAELPPSQVALAREGREAHDRYFPAQRRDRTALAALEAVNLDGHRWDVFVRWPDGRVARPQMLAVQDIYSGRVLAWRIDQTLHSGLVRLAFGDVVEKFGIPAHCVMDNGRENAAKDITGGVPTRYRFKVLDEDPAGLLPTMGVEVHWATPYRGQSKPIERAFRDFATEVAKHPAFAGAYTGNRPDAKPENYGAAAVPLDTFVKVIAEEIARHNARDGRRSDTCRGRSFDTTFFESLVQTTVRVASERQRRMFLLAARGVRAKRPDGAVELFGNRYWADAMPRFAGQKLIVRFDPQALHDGVSVYRLDGDFVADLPCLEKVGFFDADGAREHARVKAEWRRGEVAQLARARRMSLSDMAASLAKHDAEHPVDTDAPAPKVVWPLFNLVGNTARKAQPEEADDEIPEGERLLLRFAEMRRGGPLKVIEGGDD